MQSLATAKKPTIPRCTRQLQLVATGKNPNNFKARPPIYLPFPFLMPPSTYIYPYFLLFYKRVHNTTKIEFNYLGLEVLGNWRRRTEASDLAVYFLIAWMIFRKVLILVMRASIMTSLPLSKISRTSRNNFLFEMGLASWAAIGSSLCTVVFSNFF